MCEAEVRENGKKFHFIFNADGSFSVFDKTKNILQIKSFYEDLNNLLYQDDENTADILYFPETVKPAKLADNVIYFVDVNFDGYKDIVLRSNSGMYNFIYNIYTYHSETMTFDKTPFMSNLVNPQFDFDAETITTHNLGRASGDIYTDETWHFENGKYVLVNTISKDSSDTTDN